MSTIEALVGISKKRSLIYSHLLSKGGSTKRPSPVSSIADDDPINIQATTQTIDSNKNYGESTVRDTLNDSANSSWRSIANSRNNIDNLDTLSTDSFPNSNFHLGSEWSSTIENTTAEEWNPGAELDNTPCHQSASPIQHLTEKSSSIDNDDCPTANANTSNSASAYVKIASTSVAFEDIKSEAVNSWTVGVDVQLETKEVKKKAEWLSFNDFVNYEPVKREKAIMPSTSSFHTNTIKQTYAKVADSYTPSWPVQRPSNPASVTYNSENGWGSPLQHNKQHSVHDQTTDSKSPTVSHVTEVREFSTADYELLNQLASVHQKRNLSDTIPHFKKGLDQLLQTRLQFLANGNFHLLLNAIVDTMAFEKRFSLSDTIRKVYTYWPTFKPVLIKHIRFWLWSFEDLQTVLYFSMDFMAHYPKLIDDELIQELMNVYQRMKPVMPKEILIATRKTLITVCGHSLEEDSEEENVDIEEVLLPEVPDAKNIILEVVEETDHIHIYETKTRTLIANHIKEPWPAVNLRNYLLAHYLLLRQELTGPLKQVLKKLARGVAIDNLPPSCAIYEDCVPTSVTLSMATSRPGIIFQLRWVPEEAGTRRYDYLSNMQEGSIIMLLSENALNDRVNRACNSNTVDPVNAGLKGIADESILAQVIRPYSTTNTAGVRLHYVAVHILNDGITKLRWSNRYTMISSNINARSAMSTLTWFFNEYNKLDITRFSAILAPRILTAKNKLTDVQLASWSEDKHRQNLAANGRAVPDYLADAEINISCIVHRNVRQTARPGQNVWPRYSSEWEQIDPAKRAPLYTLSTSQVEAVKFALTHRVAVISGAAGTGKSFLAAKLATIISQTLVNGQFHQPVLLITKSQASLDEVLMQILQNTPDVVRFGFDPGNNDSLHAIQSTRLSIPNATDNTFRQFTNLDRRFYRLHCSLEALLKYRHRVSSLDPRALSAAIPYEYVEALRYGYINSDNTPSSPDILWSQWLEGALKATYPTTDGAKCDKDYNEDKLIQAQMEDLYLRIGGRGDMPLVDFNTLRNRLHHSRTAAYHIQDLRTAQQWPFERSTRRAVDVQQALTQVWNNVRPDQVWKMLIDERQHIAQQTADTLLRFVDDEIQMLLQDQVEIGRALDDILIQKLTYMCRFKDVIGMTADFAAANCEWVSTLWPRAIIIDEASEILETTLAPSILGFRTEHIVLLGTGDNISRIRLTNPTLAGEPRNYDVSLFERWKASTGEIALLEEQWRMHSDVATIYDQFNSSRTNNQSPSSLLITAPVASCFENKVDGRNPMHEKLQGVCERAKYVHYKSDAPEDILDDTFAEMFYSNITLADVDEARYVAFLAAYLSQQPFQEISIAIITLSSVQKAMIRHILKEEVPQRTCFTSQLSKIVVDVADRHVGREYHFVIISTATPGSSSSDYDNIPRAITRAKYGMYIIGEPDKDRVDPSWKRFARYMEERELYGHAMVLTCAQHGDQILASQASDFDKVKNGGCQRPCGSLMIEGHACKEDCHFLPHTEVICQEPCNRARPNNCVHRCKRKCFECSRQGACPPCLEHLSLTLDCGHVVEGQCHMLQNIEHVKCREPVEVNLPCGHALTIDCCDRNTSIECTGKRKVELACGHVAETKCGLDPICPERCSEILECGHRCTQMCGVPHDHKRSQCTANCSKQLICGHYCAKGCANPDNHTERCMEKCRYVCSHGYKCIRECWKDCTRCVSACPYRCKHYKCNRKCYEKCDRPPCNFACPKSLPCSHPCAGLCGEPCPPCVECYGDEHECSISLRYLSEFDEGERVYMLPECGCVFSVDCLDLYFENQAKNGEHTAIKLWGCPTCGKAIYRALRYNNYIKTEIALVNQIKMRMEQQRQQLSHHERQQIIQAMNDETAQQINHNIVGGRWFVCENQHPYFVGDCGGATEISKCPECDALIGGTQHKVLQSNRFYGEFDGSEKPAWPGQPGAD